MITARERMDILSADREVGSSRGAADICSTTPKTVNRAVLADAVERRPHRPPGRVPCRRRRVHVVFLGAVIAEHSLFRLVRPPSPTTTTATRARPRPGRSRRTSVHLGAEVLMRASGRRRSHIRECSRPDWAMHRAGRCAPNVDLMQSLVSDSRRSATRRPGRDVRTRSSPLPVRRRGRWHLTGAA